MEHDLKCQFCGKQKMNVHVSYDRSVTVSCENSACGAQWGSFGQNIRMPKGQRRKVVGK